MVLHFSVCLKPKAMIDSNPDQFFEEGKIVRRKKTKQKRPTPSTVTAVTSYMVFPRQMLNDYTLSPTLSRSNKKNKKKH